MDLSTLQDWIGLLSGGFALIAGLLAGLWAYTRFVIERGLIPPVQFYVDCGNVGVQGDKTVLEILFHLKNLGSSTLVATNIRADVLWLEVNDEPSLFEDSARRTFGRLRFPKSLRNQLLCSNAAEISNSGESHLIGNHSVEDRKQEFNEQRGIAIVPHDTFVQPGVDQIYTLVTVVPESAAYVLIWSSFQYAQKPTRLQRLILFLSRRLGLIQYSLKHVRKPHTVERVFRVREHQVGA